MNYLYIADQKNITELRNEVVNCMFFKDFPLEDEIFIFENKYFLNGYYNIMNFDMLALNTIESLTVEQFVKIMGMLGNNLNCDPEIKLPVVVTTDGEYLLLNFYSNDSEWHSSSKLLIEPRIEFYSKVYSIIEEYLLNFEKKNHLYITDSRNDFIIENRRELVRKCSGSCNDLDDNSLHFLQPNNSVWNLTGTKYDSVSVSSLENRSPDDLEHLVSSLSGQKASVPLIKSPVVITLEDRLLRIHFYNKEGVMVTSHIWDVVNYSDGVWEDMYDCILRTLKKEIV